ncbi:hypothetical protein BDR07DRAFT_1041141 [Suillus spraguei]|nr:hypothetical protein BDR07DRAFT_1041141 [Suillus spraguei]
MPSRQMSWKYSMTRMFEPSRLQFCNISTSPSQLNSIHSSHICIPIFPSNSFRPPLSPSESMVLLTLIHCTSMPGSLEEPYIRLKAERAFKSLLSAMM